jgi:hypothetical protein
MGAGCLFGVCSHEMVQQSKGMPARSRYSYRLLTRRALLARLDPFSFLVEKSGCRTV